MIDRDKTAFGIQYRVFPASQLTKASRSRENSRVSVRGAIKLV